MLNFRQDIMQGQGYYTQIHRRNRNSQFCILLSAPLLSFDIQNLTMN